MSNKNIERAAQCQARGDFQAAIRHYQQYLAELAKQRQPDPLAGPQQQAEIWHAIAGLFYQTADLAQARQALEQAVTLAPQNINYDCDLAGMLLACGQVENAESRYRTLLERVPDHLPALYNLSQILFKQQRDAELIKLLTRITALAPDWADAHHNLGVAYTAAGNHAAAIVSLRRALALQETTETHRQLALVLDSLHYYAEAIPHYEAVLAAQPHDFISRIAFAKLLNDEGQRGRGIALLTTAPAPSSATESARLATALGQLYLVGGEAAKAEQQFDAALHADPDYPDALFHKSTARKYSLPQDADLIAAVESRLATIPTTDVDANGLHFALAKILDDCREYDRAFIHAAAANKLRKTVSDNYDSTLVGQTAVAVMDWYAPGRIQRLSAFGADSGKPVFVIGMPRSGTTLTEQIIASHPQAHGAGELNYFLSLVNVLQNYTGSDLRYPACLDSLAGEPARKIASDYLQLLDRHSSSALRVIDKTPSNFWMAGLIAALLPNAAIIHVQRDALDVCLSIYFQTFEVGQDYSWDLLDTGHYYLQYHKLMRHWHSVLPDQIINFQYEQLIENPEGESRRLIAACGLEWNDACLNFHQTKREVKTASIWQVRQPLYKTSKQRWRNYEKQLQPLKELLIANGAYTELY